MQIVQVRFFFLTITFILSRAKSVKLHAQGFLAGADTGILKRVGRGGGVLRVGAKEAPPWLAKNAFVI